MIGFPASGRSTHLGTYPLETLPRDPALIEVETQRQQLNKPTSGSASEKPLARAALRYQSIFGPIRQAEVIAKKAPVPDDLKRRSKDLKGGAHFLDASQVGICLIPNNAWYKGKEIAGHQYAVVVLVEFGKFPEADNIASGWLEGVEATANTTRAAEIATILAGYIGQLGFSASAHWHGSTDIDLDRLGVLAGVAFRDGIEPMNPYLGRRYVLAAVSTEYILEVDQPLQQGMGNAKGLRYFLGAKGAVSGLERWRRNRRASHLGPYPLETLKRVDKPTTLIFDDEVPRIPQRALFYNRAEFGDLGDKMVKERWRWAYKHPFAGGILSVLRAMVPHQDDEIATEVSAETQNAEDNTKAIKSLSYYLGSAMTGICEIPDYAWYSHNKDGEKVKPYHKYAVVMLIDQGKDTFEGACGNDWISGSQSMRAYMRGGELAGVMASHIRHLGHAARPQTNVDSDVIHNPLLILAGLTEQSRIGETTLNPFIGPRFKSIVLTTDMPLVPDKPVDFGLQYYCSNCYKCARECPCNAIPFKDKVIFNGYETWKPDSERCTRYRFTNMKGSACGRCVKVCPLNKDTTLDGPLHVQIGSWLGVNAMWLKPLLVPLSVWLDDKLGHGNPNLDKKWWLDLEVVDGASVEPKQGINVTKILPYIDIVSKKRKEKIAYYPASVLPPPGSKEPFPADRKAAMAMANNIETPEQAVERRQRGEPIPEHYKSPWDDGNYR
jgi:ferredoxin